MRPGHYCKRFFRLGSCSDEVSASIAPIPELQPIVECIWTLESEPGEAGGHVEPVLPDGCPELVMQFGDRFERVVTDGTASRSRTSCLLAS